MLTNRKSARLARTGFILVASIFLLFALNACSSAGDNPGMAGKENSQASSAVMTVEKQVEAVQSSGAQPSGDQQQAEPPLQSGQTPADEPAQAKALAVEVPQPQPVQAPAGQEAPAGEQAAPPAQEAPAAGSTAAEPAAAASSVAAPAEAPVAFAQEVNPGANLPVETKPEVGFLAPNFSLTTVDGQSVRLEDLRGRPVIINYWATWCIPCKQELPILQQLSQEYAGSGIQILTIDAIEQDSLDKVNGLVSELGLTMPVLLDQQNQFQSSYNQLFFPTSYFIDKDGVLRWIKLGDAPEALLRENLEKLINNQL